MHCATHLEHAHAELHRLALVLRRQRKKLTQGSIVYSPALRAGLIQSTQTSELTNTLGVYGLNLSGW